MTRAKESVSPNEPDFICTSTSDPSSDPASRDLISYRQEVVDYKTATRGMSGEALLSGSGEIGPVDGVCSPRLQRLTSRGPARAAGVGAVLSSSEQLRASPSDS